MKQAAEAIMSSVVAKNKQKIEVPLRPLWVSTATADVTVYWVCICIVFLRHLLRVWLSLVGNFGVTSIRSGGDLEHLLLP
jgi:hypothetical protein